MVAVSIVLPTFNRLRYVRPAVESVLAQRFEDWRLLIADDGSDAETRHYLSTLSDPRVLVLRLAHTGRPSVARNAALRIARSELVAFLDSDDLWLPGKLQAQIESLRRHPQRRWSYTRFGLVDEAGSPLRAARRPSPPARSGWIRAALLEGRAVIALPSVVADLDWLMRLGPFDESLAMCEDDELWLRLAAQSEIDGIDEPLTLVRRHRQHSGSDITAWADRRVVFERLLSARPADPLEPQLRRLRAETSAGLARSQASSGERRNALRTICASARHGWRYCGWWTDALGAAVRVATPARVRRAVRALCAGRLRAAAAMRLRDVRR